MRTLPMCEDMISIEESHRPVPVNYRTRTKDWNKIIFMCKVKDAATVYSVIQI